MEILFLQFSGSGRAQNGNGVTGIRTVSIKMPPLANQLYMILLLPAVLSSTNKGKLNYVKVKF